MPAVDQCEAQMIRAFEKAGWLLTRHPLQVAYDSARRARLYIDLLIHNVNTPTQFVAVEVKCFAGTEPLLDQFYGAVGQLLVYRNALKLAKLSYPLYLAVPDFVYATEISKPLYQAVLKDARISHVLVDLEKEQVTRWIP